MASSLKNKQALARLLAGEHKTQSRTSVFFNSDSVNIQQPTRKVGDVWYEPDPTTNLLYRWEQKQGYKVKQSLVAWAMENAYSRSRGMFEKCYDDCEKRRTGEYTITDKKLGKKTQMCLECLAKYETKLRYQGRQAFDSYAKEKLMQNAQAFFAEADVEVQMLKGELTKGISYVNANGAEESWTMQNVEDMLNRIDEEYAKFKEETLRLIQEPSQPTEQVEQP